MARSITRDNLGAWLIKCDPETRFDLPGWIEDGNRAVDDWSVVRSYRSDLMSEGDRIVLWVSGNGRRLARGIWGLGFVQGPAEDAAPVDEDALEVSYWHDLEARQAVQLFVPLHIPLLEEPVTAEELLAAGINDLEVQRMAAGSNPSWISKDQLARMDDLLPAWPNREAPSEEITISKGGAGVGNVEDNAVTEAAAMAAVMDYYEDWVAEDVSRDKVGWDITFTRAGEQVHVEVKGVTGPAPTVLLTKNELKAAEEQADWYLAVVTRALSDPVVTEYTAQEALAAATPYVYKAVMPPRAG